MAFQYPLISVEEHWLSTRVQDLYRARGVPDAHDDKGPIGMYVPPLKDLEHARLESMNSTGIAIQVVSHVANSIAVDIETCVKVNDELHSLTQQNPTRYAAFAILPMSNPRAASEELYRCVMSLRFVGAMIDSNCEGKVYDDNRYWEVFRAAEELDVPIYLHPAPNDDAAPMLKGKYPDGVATTLSQFAWGWHSETGLHFLRLYAAGLFDQFPRLKIILGHCGEMLPFMLDRVQGITDRALPLLGCRRERSLRQVWDENVWVSISGMFTVAPMLTVLEQCKPDHVLYSVDYPFGHNDKGPEFLLKLRERGLIDDEKVRKIAYTNAQNLLKITVSSDRRDENSAFKKKKSTLWRELCDQGDHRYELGRASAGMRGDVLHNLKLKLSVCIETIVTLLLPIITLVLDSVWNKRVSNQHSKTAGMPNTETVHVPHLGGIDAAYQMPRPYDASKPTLVLINSYTTSSELYRAQYANDALTGAMNLLAIELLGHGDTRTKSEHFTYWDTAIMNLQVLDALGIEKAFVLGTSQGGWITVRMALLAPEKIAGIIPLGTSMDYESERSRSLGCWDGIAACTGPFDAWTSSTPTPDFEIDDGFCAFLVREGFGASFPEEEATFWRKTLKENYRGDDGRKRARMATLNLRDRDGLHGRVADVLCPVLWLHGTADTVYSVANAKEEIKMFTNAKAADLQIIEGGAHFLSASHPKEVDRAIVEFVQKWA